MLLPNFANTLNGVYSQSIKMQRTLIVVVALRHLVYLGW